MPLLKEIEGKSDLEYVACKTVPTYADQKKCWDAILADIN